MSPTAGEQLREARVQRGLTLEQVSQITRVRMHYLEALENDLRDRLPSAVQARGFLRLYAGAVGLKPELLLAAWDGKPIPPVEVTPAAAPKTAPEAGIAAADESTAAGAANTDQPDPAASMPQPAAPVERALEPLYAPEPPRLTVPLGEEEPVSGSQQIFNEIGDTLRRQRESLGLTWAEVERYTRLRQHYIQAMEEGRTDKLPSPVQGRGMLSNYAAFLNLDEEQMLLRFAEGLQLRRVERIPQPDPQNLFPAKKRPAARPAPLWRRFLTPDLIFGFALAVVILFFTIWTVERVSRERAAEVEPTPPSLAEVLQQTPLIEGTGVDLTALPGATTEADGTPEPAAETRPTFPVGEMVGGATAVSPIETPGEGTPGVETPGAGSPADITPTGSAATLAIISDAVEVTETPVNPPNLSAPLEVYIVARQRAWLLVSVDGQVKFQGRTVPGNAYPFSGSKSIEMRTGNAAALQVFYNQEDLGVLGQTGQVIGLVFGAEGVMTPTPAFTATPTVTPPATLTPLPSPTLRATPTITPYVPR